MIFGLTPGILVLKKIIANINLPAMRVLLLIALFSISIAVQAQNALEMPKKLETGIKKGDATIVARFFNQNVELSIEGENNIYSCKQAEFVLQKFFRKHKTKSFYIKHQGGKTNTSYIIGNLATTNGNYKLILLLKETNNSIKIHQLRIDND